VSTKKRYIWTFVLLGSLILLLFLANFYVKQKIGQELDDKLEPSAYEDLSVNIFLNNFSIRNVEMRQGRFAVNAQKISAGGLSYYDFLFNNKLEIDELEFSSPTLRVFPADSVRKSKRDKPQKDSREVLIRRISLQDGTFSKKSSDSSAASVYAHIPAASVRNVKPGMQLSQLKSYELELDTLYLKMNPEHYIDVGQISAEDGQVEINDFKIRSFFARSQFDRKIPYEKDHVTLDVKNISLDSLDISHRRDTILLRSPQFLIDGAYLDLYRNKLVADYPGVKPLYSKMLREAPFFLDIEKVVVENSEILYEERSKPEGEPARVRFAAVNGKIDNMHNLRELSSRPHITANADFMRGTPVEIDWTFPVFDPLDPFEISGSFGTLQGKALDPFLIPALNAQARGTVNDVYFNFYGNDDVLQGDFRMNYEEFKIELLSEENEKKGFLSSLANLFVDNKQEPDEGEGQDVRVERAKNRSFWNFAWKGLREGLLDALGQI
jgi:hypothetical protein